MTHPEALALYGDYFAGRLGREATRAFHGHLNDCEDCKVRLRAMRAAAPRPDFGRGGASEAEREARTRNILWKNRVITYAVLAILLCFFFFFRLKRGS